MIKETHEGETHCVCDKRLKEECGKATCCYCNPHEGCDINQEQPKKCEHCLKGNCLTCYNNKIQPKEKIVIGKANKQIAYGDVVYKTDIDKL